MLQDAIIGHVPVVNHQSIGSNWLFVFGGGGTPWMID